MVRIQRFWSRHSVTARGMRSAVLLTVAAGASDTQSRRLPQPTATAVRPHVAITVSIESELYRRKLDGAENTCGPN